jgi:hypothetical protein
MNEKSRPGLRSLKNFVYFNRRFNSNNPTPAKKKRRKKGKKGRGSEVPKDILEHNPYDSSLGSPHKNPGSKKRRKKSKRNSENPLDDVMDFFMTEDPYAGEGDYMRYKPDSHIIGTRDRHYSG